MLIKSGLETCVLITLCSLERISWAENKQDWINIPDSISSVKPTDLWVAQLLYHIIPYIFIIRLIHRNRHLPVSQIFLKPVFARFNIVHTMAAQFLNSTIPAMSVKEPEMFKSKRVPETMPQKETKLKHTWILG